MMHLGLTGFPVEHSLSPKLHNAALRATGLEGEYSLYPADPTQPQALVDLLLRIRSGELTGLNVTIPHKQAVIPLLDASTPTAQAIGAVNLITMQAGELTGHNTDVPGFLTDLNIFLAQNHLSHLRRNALVLGAGGSARAVAYTLVSAGWQVTLAARRVEQAQVLIESLKINDDHIPQAIPLYAQALFPLLDTLGMVVNTTPVGMYPKSEFSPWPTEISLPRNAAFYDLVYNPPETQLVKRAREAGLPATAGLGMLIEQARLSFEIWSGRSVSREAMFAALEEE